jgi:hypothetical protein
LVQLGVQEQEEVILDLLEQDLQETHHQLVHHKEIQEEVFNLLVMVEEEGEEQVQQEVIFLLEIQVQQEERDQQIVLQVHQRIMLEVEEVEHMDHQRQDHQQEDQEELEVEEQEGQQEIQELQEQLTLEVVVEDPVVEEDLLVEEDQEDQESLLLEHQDLLICQYHQELTQLQHYRHQLEVVKLQHLLYLELIHLQLVNNRALYFDLKILYTV